MNGYFAQMALDQNGKPFVANTGLIGGLVAGSLILQFNGVPPRRKILPVAHPIVQSLEIFDSLPALKIFQKSLAEQIAKEGVLTTQDESDPQPEAEIESEAEVEAEPELDEQEESPSPVPAAKARAKVERDNLLRKNSRLWKVEWKTDDYDTMYVQRAGSEKEVKQRIAGLFGPQKESAYKSITQVLESEVPDDGLLI